MAAISPDQRVQALLIAFAFGTFLEGAAGFGTPVAIARPVRPVRGGLSGRRHHGKGPDREGVGGDRQARQPRFVQTSPDLLPPWASASAIRPARW